jgi:hypothetical protein
MAYSTGSATSQADLMSQLATFAVAQGWTQDILSTTNRWLALNNGSVYVQFRWDLTNAIAVFQSLGFTGTGTAPGNQTGDSGVGAVDASAPYDAAITTQRRVQVGNGPYVSHHFFTDGTTKYIHCVLEYSSGLYRHFGFGTIDKKGTWTGGEYAYGHRWAVGANSDNPRVGGTGTANSGQNVMFDSLGGAGTSTDANEAGCTMHMEGITGQPAGSKWGMFLAQSTTLGNDTAGNARFRLSGGGRGGVYLHDFGFFRASLLNGYVPLNPIPIWWINTTPSPQAAMLLGFVADIRMCNIGNINPAQEFTVGADTWKVFPMTRKKFLQDDTEESWNWGVAYRKVP